mgnify:CR=1 FL=1
MELCKLTLAEIKEYLHVDYDDDNEIITLIADAVTESMQDLISEFDPGKMNFRQKLYLLVSVKDLYDNRQKYEKSGQTLSQAASTLLMQEMYSNGN